MAPPAARPRPSWATGSGRPTKGPPRKTGGALTQQQQPTRCGHSVPRPETYPRDAERMERIDEGGGRGGRGGRGGGGYAFKKPRNIKTEKRKWNREAGSRRRRQAKGPGTGTPMDFLRRPLRGWWRAVKRRTAAAARARKRIDRSRPLARSPRSTAACRQVPGRVRRWRQIPTVYFSQVVTERRVGRAVPPI